MKNTIIIDRQNISKSGRSLPYQSVFNKEAVRYYLVEYKDNNELCLITLCVNTKIVSVSLKVTINDVPSRPGVPSIPEEPLDPEEPLVPFDPLIPEEPLDPEEPLVPE